MTSAAVGDSGATRTRACSTPLPSGGRRSSRSSSRITPSRRTAVTSARTSGIPTRRPLDEAQASPPGPTRAAPYRRSPPRRRRRAARRAAARGPRARWATGTPSSGSSVWRGSGRRAADQPADADPDEPARRCRRRRPARRRSARPRSTTIGAPAQVNDRRTAWRTQDFAGVFTRATGLFTSRAGSVHLRRGVLAAGGLGWAGPGHLRGGCRTYESKDHQPCARPTTSSSTGSATTSSR